MLLIFAFETTLATRSYVALIKRAKQLGYRVTLLFFWLDSPEMAFKRVIKRVSLGGHSIPKDVVFRRYYRGIFNLLVLYNLFVTLGLSLIIWILYLRLLLKRMNLE